jgi:hypothetical protein
MTNHQTFDKNNVSLKLDNEGKEYHQTIPDQHPKPKAKVGSNKLVYRQKNLH